MNKPFRRLVVAGLVVALGAVDRRRLRASRQVEPVQEERRRRRHPDRRLGGLVRLHRQLRPDRRVPRRRMGDLLEPAHPLAHGLEPPRRAPRATSSSRISRRRCRSRPNGGKTYTFKLKSGVKFAPPVNRAVTVDRTSSTRSSGSRTRRTAVSTPSTTPTSIGWANGAKGKNDLGHHDAERHRPSSSS